MYEDYEPVADRVQKFYKDHPDGSIITTVIRDDTIVVVQATVRANETHVATGHAHQVLLTEPPKGKTGPNYFAPEWTSPYEVCETSAVGRALANLGYAAKGPSAEEMHKAFQAIDVSGVLALMPAPWALEVKDSWHWPPAKTFPVEQVPDLLMLILQVAEATDPTTEPPPDESEGGA